MDFQMSLFWICFIIITKITFTVFDLNPIQHDFARYFRRVICNNIPIEIRSVKILTQLIQKSKNGNRKTVDGDYAKSM